MKQTLWDSCTITTLFPPRCSLEKHTVSPLLCLTLTHGRGATVTEESDTCRSGMCLPFTRDCNPPRNLSCNLPQVCFDCLCVWVKRNAAPLHETTAKISMTFFFFNRIKKILFFRHRNRNQMACRGETKAFLPFWTSHSLSLGAQALHKMSIDKFSSAYVTHAQFESYWWGRKKPFILVSAQLS